MGVVSYLEDIIDRHIASQGFDSIEPAAHAKGDYAAELRERLAPLLAAIRAALTTPEARHLMRAEEAEWSALAAEVRLEDCLREVEKLKGQIAQRDTRIRELVRAYEAALETASKKLAAVERKAEAMRDSLDQFKISSKREREELKRLRENKLQIEKRSRDLENDLIKSVDQIQGLNRVVMGALVDKRIR